MPSWAPGSWHLVPKPSAPGGAVGGAVTAAARAGSAVMRKLQELGAQRDEKRPDYIMVVEAQTSGDDKGPPTGRNNLVRFSVLPDVCSPDQHIGSSSEKLSYVWLRLHRGKGTDLLERWPASI